MGRPHPTPSRLLKTIPIPVSFKKLNGAGMGIPCTCPTPPRLVFFNIHHWESYWWYTTAIWAEIVVMVSGSVLYQKNWFRNERSTHKTVPRTTFGRWAPAEKGRLWWAQSEPHVWSVSSFRLGRFQWRRRWLQARIPPFDTAENREIENVNFLLQRCEEEEE